MEKLDNFNKILIATSAINYMASSVNMVNEQLKMMPNIKPFEEGIEVKNKFLEVTLLQLSKIMEDMGNFINSGDIICPLDVRVTTPAFEIIIGGKDNVDE